MAATWHAWAKIEPTPNCWLRTNLRHALGVVDVDGASVEIVRNVIVVLCYIEKLTPYVGVRVRVMREPSRTSRSVAVIADAFIADGNAHFGWTVPFEITARIN